MKTLSANPTTVKSDWFVVDASDMILGRLAAQVAYRLRGKHKPDFTPHVNTGDHIVVINADKVRVTGDKETKKIYYHHSRFPGGIKAIAYRDMAEKHPERVIEQAIQGMLPKGVLGRDMFRMLKVYAGEQHPHQAQQPQELKLKGDR
jgi:large subunit ribosomal protein L13